MGSRKEGEVQEGKDIKQVDGGSLRKGKKRRKKGKQKEVEEGKEDRCNEGCGE